MKKVFSEAQISDMFNNALHKVRTIGLLDLHTHLFPLHFGPTLSLLGPDAVIDYHYLYGEALSDSWLSNDALEAFWKLKRKERVDWIIENTYGDQCLPISEGRLGPLTIAHRLGIDTSSGSMQDIINDWRTYYNDLGDEAYLNKIFSFDVRRVICTNSVFDLTELPLYLDGSFREKWDSRFECGLRLDEAIHKRSNIKSAWPVKSSEYQLIKL